MSQAYAWPVKLPAKCQRHISLKFDFHSLLITFKLADLFSEAVYLEGASWKFKFAINNRFLVASYVSVSEYEQCCTTSMLKMEVAAQNRT